MMPVMSGLDLAEAVHVDGRQAHVPIVMFTAHADPNHVVETTHAAASIEKRLRADTLLERRYASERPIESSRRAGASAT
jgi:CheY-like chemotaxis protein